MSHKTHPVNSPSPMDGHNVLFLGETQSRKSTVIKCTRMYASPTVHIDTKALGTGFISHTQEVAPTSVVTDVPEYYVANHKKGTRVSHGELVRKDDEYDYKDVLIMRNGLEATKGAPRLTKNIKINLIGTSGLNPTGNDNNLRAQEVYNCLETAKTVHLVVITTSGPLTRGLQDVINSYVDIFPGVDGIVAFVHTHFDYKNFHPARVQVSQAIDFKTHSLHKLMGGKTFPHFKIDCDVYKKPIRECITQNTIQKFLELAPFKHSVNMPHTVINQPRKLRDIDGILTDKFEATLKTIEMTLRFKVPDEGYLHSEIFLRYTQIRKLEASIKLLDESPICYGVNRANIMHEDQLFMKHKGDSQEQVTPFRSPLSALNATTTAAKSQKRKSRIGLKHQEYAKLKQELLALNGGEHAKHDEKLKNKNTVDTHIEGVEPLEHSANMGSAHVDKSPEPHLVYLGDTTESSKQAQMHPQSQPAPEPKRCGGLESLPGTQERRVLVLGKTQAGKTAFIENIKRYADPAYTIDQACLGDGIFSKTDKSHTICAVSDLPPCQVYDKRSGTTIDFNMDEGDEEDIHDKLLRRDDNIGIRQATWNLSSDAIKFEFMDTPGLCNHEDKDVAHATDIIDGILSRHSFNLILIVVNIHDPFSAEQLLALEYYSKVLDGLHSKIAFVYTHADYGNYLKPNKEQRSALEYKTKILSRIFDKSPSGDLETYPSFTIGLTEKRLPFVQCLMQHTLREILQLAASNLPAAIDTNKVNVERIKSITHPSNMDEMLRDKTIARIYRQLRPQTCVPGSPPSEPIDSTLPPDTSLIGSQSGSISHLGPGNLDTEAGLINSVEPVIQESASAADEPLDSTQLRYNVLVLGRTQSGKSSLVEYLRMDADHADHRHSTYSIDRSRLGDGCNSRTKSIERFPIHSDLVAYEVVEENTQETIQLQDLGARIQEEKDYQNLLGRRENGHDLRKISRDPNLPPPDLMEFCIVDTPGFNDTCGGSINIAKDVINEIVSTRSFNLILIVVSVQSPLTKEYGYELEFYAKLLKGMHSNIAFLYTHVDYYDCHHSNTTHHSRILTRHAALSRIFRELYYNPQESSAADNSTAEQLRQYRYFAIDLHPNKKKWPVVQGMTRNTLRDILSHAKDNSPAVVDISKENIDRMNAIPHPDEANLEYRKLMGQANLVPEDGVLEQTAADVDLCPATFMPSTFSDSGIAGFSCEFRSVDEMEIDTMTT